MKIVVNGARYRDLPVIDPQRVAIEADLSRADVAVLHELCAGRTVVEFGCGGSTLLLARFSRIVLSYDHDVGWLERVARVARRRAQKGVRMSRIVLQHVPEGAPPPKLPRVDVLFVDGERNARHLWVERALRARVARVVVIHDSRRPSPLADCSSLITWPLTRRIDRVLYHYKNSNHVVVCLRDESVRYVDWNKAEPRRRLPHLHV